MSYACSDSPPGIGYEHLENWPGAVLAHGSTIYLAVPGEFLDVHGTREAPDWEVRRHRS